VHLQQLVQSTVDALDIVNGIEPPLDSRLVRHADDEKSVVMGQAEGRGDPPVELEQGRVLEVVEVGIESSVPVDKHRSTSVRCRRRERLRPPASESSRTISVRGRYGSKRREP